MRLRERRLDDDQSKILPRSESLGEVRHLKLRSESTGARAIGALATGAAAIGSLAIGAAAIGALAIGALVIGRLAIGHIRIRRVVVDDLVVRRLRITEKMHVPDKLEAEKSASAREVDSSS